MPWLSLLECSSVSKISFFAYCTVCPFSQMVATIVFVLNVQQNSFVKLYQKRMCAFQNVALLSKKSATNIKIYVFEYS